MKTPPLALPIVLALAAAFAADAAAQPRKPPTPEAKEAKSSECAAMGELPKAWDGQAFAIDGKTLGGVGLKAHLRIWGIQAPELRDANKAESVAGMRARAFLADLLAKADHKVKCRPARFDRECRIVAQCGLADPGTSTDLGGSMIAGGMAYGFDLDEALPWETRAGQRDADAEFEARKARKGLWPIWMGDQ
jgi:endonuclease YncB( thermonuclease family)